MVSLNTSIGTTIATKIKTAQMQHVNRQTVDCQTLRDIIDEAVPRNALKRFTIHAIDSNGASVLTATVDVNYDGDVPSFDLMSPSAQPEFLLGTGEDPTLGPERETPYCDMWRDVLDEYMKIRDAMGYGLKWTVWLDGPDAKYLDQRFGLSPSNIVCKATKPLGDSLTNTHTRDLKLQLFAAPDVADQNTPR